MSLACVVSAADAQGMVPPRFATKLPGSAPQALAFDLAGSAWVVDASGTVTLCVDRDGDGRAERMTTFVDGLVQPRAIVPLLPSMALVLEPPNLILVRDNNDDGVADERRIVGGGLEGGTGLVLTADGTIFVTGTTARLRWDGRRVQPLEPLASIVRAIVETDDGTLLSADGREIARWNPVRATSIAAADCDCVIDRLILAPSVHGLLATDSAKRSIAVIEPSETSWKWRCDVEQTDTSVIAVTPSGELCAIIGTEIVDLTDDPESTPRPLATVPGSTIPQGEALALLLADARPSMRAAAREALVAWCGEDASRIALVSGPLRALATTHASDATRREALWTAHRIGVLQEQDVRMVLRDTAPSVRRVGVTLARARDARAALRDADASVREAALDRAAAALAESSDMAETNAWLDALVDLAVAHGSSEETRTALAAALEGSEIVFARRLVATLGSQRPWWLRPLLVDLADAALGGETPETTRATLELASNLLASGATDEAHAVLARVAVKAGGSARRQRAVQLDRRPDGYAPLLASWSSPTAAKIDPWIRWPNRTDLAMPIITPSMEETIELGRRLYTTCLTCHGPAGRGQPGVYPPLVGSEFVLGDPERFAKIVLHGLRGPVKVGDVELNGLMPKPVIGSGLDNDAEIAAVMSYVRQAFGNQAPPVSTDLVRRVREANRDRTTPWDTSELQTKSANDSAAR